MFVGNQAAFVASLLGLGAVYLDYSPLAPFDLAQGKRWAAVFRSFGAWGVLAAGLRGGASTFVCPVFESCADCGGAAFCLKSWAGALPFASLRVAGRTNASVPTRTGATAGSAVPT